MSKIVFALIYVLLPMVAIGAPHAPDYSWAELSGSALPYPESDMQPLESPDSLRAVMINHVGRHGARYPTSKTSACCVRKFLMQAYDAGSLTPRGVRLLALTDSVLSLSSGRWGRLDSLGVAEQRDLASRMFLSFPDLFEKGAEIEAISSPKPRCVMSMYAFLHELTLLNEGGLAITTASGTARCDSLLRFFDTDRFYRTLIMDNTLLNISEDFATHRLDDRFCNAILRRLGGEAGPDGSTERRRIVETIYAVVAGCGAMSIDVDPSDWFTKDEYRRIWSVKNFKQYIHYSASAASQVPATMAAPLLQDLITTTDGFIADDGSAPVKLRFGHAETLMPLLSLMKVDGAYYVTDKYATVASHWHNFSLVPMAANIWMTLYRAKSGAYYMRIDINGQPVRLPGCGDSVYIPWERARQYLLECLPPESRPQ